MEFTTTNLLIGLVIIVLLVFVLRDFNCWYWKINKRIKLQEKTNNLLQELINKNNSNSFSQSKTATNDIELTDEQLIKGDVNDPKVLESIINKLNEK